MERTKSATHGLAHFAIAMAQQLSPFTPVPQYPVSSQAWIVPTHKAYKLALRNQPLFPDVRRMLVDLQSIGDSDNTFDECDDAAEFSIGVIRSATSSLTSDGSLPMSPQDQCATSARWLHFDGLPEEDSSTGYIVDSFNELSLAEPITQKELVASFDEKPLASNVGPKSEDTVTVHEFASFSWVRALGEGGFAATVAVRERTRTEPCDNTKGRLLCLKIFVKSTMRKQDLVFGVQRELLAYQALASADRDQASTFVMQLDGALEDPDRIYFAMELMKYDLMAVLTEGKPGRSQHRKRWIAQIAAGLDALHGLGIIHRDIKPENLMIDCRDNIRIADLGASYISPRRERLFAAGEYTDEMLGTWPYIAPEVMDTKDKPKSKRKSYGTAVDYWALGCILFELEAPGSPLLFETEEDLNHYRRWDVEKTQGLSFIAAMGLPHGAESLVLGLVHLDPRRRYDIKDLRQHGYFRKGDGTSEFDNIEALALNRPKSHLNEDGDEIANLDSPPVFRPIMKKPTGAVHPSSFDNLCWINPRGIWGR
ncbi:hypothetical protein APHAL10511_007950 [Amanita phalloides]|nr:hypothetical protein APHAL10511_007950 [Amanita phalloides]